MKMRPVMVVGATPVVGCVSAPAPREQGAQAELAVEQAQRLDADEHAPLEMRLARDKLDRARDALRSDDNRIARRKAEQAHGEALPVAPNGTEAGRQKSRRVEIILPNAG